MVVLSLVDGYVNESTILEVAPSIINHALAEPLTPLNDCMFLVPLKNREEVKEVCKLGMFKMATKDGPCTMKLASYSAELGADGEHPVKVDGSSYGIYRFTGGAGALLLKSCERRGAGGSLVGVRPT